MEVRNCKGCGRLFNYVSGVSYTNLCPRCIEQLEEKFQQAKKYIEDNKGAGVKEVAEAVDVKVSQIERWIREERLCFSDESAVMIGCERCGTMIRSGRFCEACKSNMTRALGSMYGTGGYEVTKTKKGSAAGKMRFLEK